MLKYQVVPTKNPVDGQVVYYARLVPVIPISIDEICHDISEQSTLTEHDVKAVISALEEQVIKFLREGFSVSFGDLGTFRPSIRAASGAATPEEVNNSYIKGVHVVYQPSVRMKSELSRNNPAVRLVNAVNAPTNPSSPTDPPESGGEQVA